ncbi:MAG: 4-demethylwyosine synthase TYW1 [Candidatus Micrarchaeota archaeon]
MLSPDVKADLERQHYRVVGNHSAVKICGWTKNMLRKRGSCYKHKFYGIRSNQCLQMTTSISCANRCMFCWRGYKAPVSTDWKWGVDGPNFIIDQSLKAQKSLLMGFKGCKHIDMPIYEESRTVKHVALSLTGEPIVYPKINEIIDEFHIRKISTFLVTKGQYPDYIKNLKPVTQFYLSLDAPTKELLKEIDVPLFLDYWERLNQSLEHLAQKKQRTCIRLTLIRYVNMNDHENYAKMIMKGKPDFIEAKSYMHVGPSQQRLKRENMPLHLEIVEFSKELVKYLPDYEIISEHIPSRVVMFAKKKFRKDGKWHTWIDFDKFNELALFGNEFSSDDYSCLMQ